MSEPAMPMSLSAPLTYALRSERHASEKPYAFKYALKKPVAAPSNVERGLSPPVNIIDMRGRESDFTLAQHGFTVWPVSTGLAYEDYHDDARIQPYFRALEARLKEETGAARVHVFRHGLRKRHASYPIYEGRVFEYEQPASGVHIDTTLRNVYSEVRLHFPDEADELKMRRIQWYNIWKPLKGPLHDWPLALCDASSVDPARDLLPADLVYPDHLAENCCLHYNPNHRWYYLSGQSTEEAFFFIQGDTLKGARPGVPHCAVANPLAPDDAPLRESIEARALAFY